MVVGSGWVLLLKVCRVFYFRMKYIWAMTNGYEQTLDNDS